MNDEAESSAAGLRHARVSAASVDATDAVEHAVDAERSEEADARERLQQIKERRIGAKKKRINYLDSLLRQLDNLVFLELITLYHLDCSFFWFFIRAMIHVALLTPLPELQLAHQRDEHKPFLPLVIVCFAINLFLHLFCTAPSADEETRGYLHGGLMIDFIGQKGPSSKCKLAGLDVAILILQIVMVSVHVKRRELRKTLADGGEGPPTSTATNGTDSHAEPHQDADSEERGVLRRSDTMSDAGVIADEEDTLLPSSDAGHADALDLLSSGQAVVGDFSLIDTLWREHKDYQEYRQTHADNATASTLSPSTLRQLHAIRLRFGVGGGA